MPSRIVRDATIHGSISCILLDRDTAALGRQNSMSLRGNVLHAASLFWHRAGSRTGKPRTLMKIHRSVAFALCALSPLLLIASPETDRKIEDAAVSSYNFRTVLAKQVNVKSQDGVVTLTGTVLDRDQKALAEDTVRGLPGVTEVNNRLEVSSASTEHSDGWIALKIKSTLLVRSNVSATNTKVSVHNGEVTLTGMADNVAQKELTEEYARDVDGVKKVQNEITVREPGLAEQSPSNPTMSERVDDASITAQVKYALLTHRATSAIDTKVETHDGVVVLHGKARSAAEKDLVSKLTRDVRGVTSVRNEMTLQAAE